MSNKTLSKEEAAKLLQKADKSTSTVSDFVRLTEWPSTNNKVALYKAAREHEPQVTFDDGRVFNITYKEKGKLIYINPAGPEFVPCGYFNLKRIKDEIEEWI